MSQYRYRAVTYSANASAISEEDWVLGAVLAILSASTLPRLMEFVGRVVLVDVGHHFDQRRRIGGQSLAQGAAQAVGGLDAPRRHAEGAGVSLEIWVGQQGAGM